MSIAANAIIAMIVSFRFKLHHPFSHILFPLVHSYGRKRLLSPGCTLGTGEDNLSRQWAAAV